MPRITPLEPRDLNVYDAIFNGMRDINSWDGIPDELASSGYHRMFTNRNIGRQELTNLQVSETIACDQAAWILNWYARTNIPPIRELDDWAHSATATLTVGMAPITRQCVFDLLRRNEGVRPPLELLPPPHDRAYLIDSISRRALEAYQGAVGSREALFDLPPEQQQAWKLVAEAMYKLFHEPRVIVIPIRQCFSVRIDSSPDAFAALREAVLAIGEGDDIKERPIQPRARMWIHLEGFSFYTL